MSSTGEVERPVVGVAQAIVAGLGGLVLMWLSVAVTLAMAVPDLQPDLVLALWPSAAVARTVDAWDALSGSPTAAQRAEAFTMAGAALRREPVLAPAAAALGAASGLLGREAQANAAFGYAERLSRRDLQTQMWFIERAVQRGDVGGALRHYDIGLRTDSSANQLLLPVLARASNDVAVRRPLIALLGRKPSWRMAYLQAMLAAPLRPVALAEQIAGPGLDPTDPADAQILSGGLTQLVRARQYLLATAVLPAATRTGLRNASFEQVPLLLPFDWWLSTDADLLAYREPDRAGDGAYVLRIASDNRGGPVARQLITLPAGRFALSGVFGNTAPTGSRPSVAVACVDDPHPLTDMPLGAVSAGRFDLAFTVPGQRCPAQWITIAAPAASSVSAWIDALRLHRIIGG